MCVFFCMCMCRNQIHRGSHMLEYSLLLLQSALFLGADMAADEE